MTNGVVVGPSRRLGLDFWSLPRADVPLASGRRAVSVLREQNEWVVTLASLQPHMQGDLGGASDDWWVREERQKARLVAQMRESLQNPQIAVLRPAKE